MKTTVSAWVISPLLDSASYSCQSVDWVETGRYSDCLQMGGTSKLSVGKTLEKLRGTDTPKTKMTRLDEKINALEEETRRLRAARRRLERDQRAGANKRG